MILALFVFVILTELLVRFASFAAFQHTICTAILFTIQIAYRTIRLLWADHRSPSNGISAR